jgi:choline-sulfatase
MESEPDIVWVCCDELRTDALGCYGHPTIRMHTPNIDRLAASGVRFTNNFCNSPVCVPSRMCTLTGLHPRDTGVYDNEGGWRNFRMPYRPDTFPEVFAGSGYQTANFGKIHVAREMSPGQNPDREVFQQHNGQGGGMGFWSHLGDDGVQMIRSPIGGMNGGVYPDCEPYPPDKVTANALRWIRSAEGPFLVRISLLQPHTPVLPPEGFVRLYQDQDPGLPEPLPDTMSEFEKRVADIHGLDRMPPEELKAARLCYYAQVAWIDTQVGLVLAELERRGRLHRTIIMFGSDHGNPIGDSGAFGKHTFTPTVHRVPLIISGPGILPKGEVRTDLCESLDIGRTLLGLAGVSAPDSFKGRDLFVDPAPEAIYSAIGFGQPDSKLAPNGGIGEWSEGRGWPRRSCIRTGRFRLEKNVLLDGRKPAPDDEDVFLVDVRKDPREFTNLAADPSYADVVSELSAKLDKHTEDMVEIPIECLVR